MTDFLLHPRLNADTLPVASLELSELLMVNDNQYPWFILVPRQSYATEIYQLSSQHQHQLLSESCLLAQLLQNHFKPDKLNIATIGNLVPQLHMHHICRYSTDPVWPAPVWGQRQPQAYNNENALIRIREMQNALGFALGQI